ncbi:MAG: response regulator, partial [Lachnospiraceae bacterium]|nr:response regulator [Lachnospiraceae bacterium]
LSIAKQLTELMDGELLVESEYGKGSSFTMKIKQRVADSNPIKLSGEDIKKVRKNYKSDKKHFIAKEAKVLVVDDNKMNITVITTLLKRTSIQTDTALSGKECIEKTKNNQYDLILLDHMMPELDGIDTLKLIRNDDKNPNKNGKIIVLTANAVLGCKEQYLSEGFDDYFSKPIQVDKLDELLLKYLPKEYIEWND